MHASSTTILLVVNSNDHEFLDRFMCTIEAYLNWVKRHADPEKESFLLYAVR